MHSPLGYAVGSRKLMEQLHFNNVRVSFENAYDQVDGPTEEPLIDDLMKRTPSRARSTSRTARPTSSAVPTPVTRSATRCSRSPACPQDWVEGCNRMDEVWVPASFNVDTFRNSGVTVPIHVMPLGVDPIYFNPEIRAERVSDSFTFLSVFEWGERKAPEVLLRAFAREFARARGRHAAAVRVQP